MLLLLLSIFHAQEVKVRTLYLGTTLHPEAVWMLVDSYYFWPWYTKLPNMVSAQAPQKCDLARQTLSHKGPWGTPIPNMCALEITLSGAEKHIIPTHVLNVLRIFSPVLDVFAGTLGIPPAGNERLCYDLPIKYRAYYLVRRVCVQCGKVRTARKQVHQLLLWQIIIQTLGLRMRALNQLRMKRMRFLLFPP